MSLVPTRTHADLCLLSVFSSLAALLLPFRVTKPVTSRVMSVAVVSRDVNLVVWEVLIGSSYDVSIRVP